MSIISFIPNGKSWIITLSQDSNVPVDLIPPKQYNEFSGKLLFPKEAHIPGFCFIVHEKGWIGVILSLYPHSTLKESAHRLLLNKLLYDLFCQLDPLQYLKSLVFSDYEPFKLILFYKFNLYEFEWNGKILIDRYLSNQIIHYWENSPDLSKNWVSQRAKLFKDKLENPAFDLSHFIIAMHKKYGEEKQQFLNIYPEQTSFYNVAIIQVVVTDKVLRYYFYDLLHPQYFTHTSLINLDLV